MALQLTHHVQQQRRRQGQSELAAEYSPHIAPRNEVAEAADSVTQLWSQLWNVRCHVSTKQVFWRLHLAFSRRDTISGICAKRPAHSLGANTLALELGVMGGGPCTAAEASGMAAAAASGGHYCSSSGGSGGGSGCSRASRCRRLLGSPAAAGVFPMSVDCCVAVWDMRVVLYIRHAAIAQQGVLGHVGIESSGASVLARLQQFRQLSMTSAAWRQHVAEGCCQVL